MPISLRITLGQLDASIGAALAERSSLRREELLNQLADSIDLADIPAALKMLAKHTEPALRFLLARRLLTRWGRLDATAALAYAQALPNSIVARSAALASVLEGWLQQDSSAATQWIKQLPSGPEKNQLLQTAVNTLSMQSPQEALSFVNGLKLTPSRRLGLPDLAGIDLSPRGPRASRNVRRC